MNTAKAIINLKYLKENFKYLKSKSNDAEIFPVIKANAYGHGLKSIAKALKCLNVKCVCVATINEIIDLVDLNLKYGGLFIWFYLKGLGIPGGWLLAPVSLRNTTATTPPSLILPLLLDVFC